MVVEEVVFTSKGVSGATLVSRKTKRMLVQREPLKVSLPWAWKGSGWTKVWHLPHECSSAWSCS